VRGRIIALVCAMTVSSLLVQRSQYSTKQRWWWYTSSYQERSRDGSAVTAFHSTTSSPGLVPDSSTFLPCRLDLLGMPSLKLLVMKWSGSMGALGCILLYCHFWALLVRYLLH
jgi:hypothetical protein